MTAKAAPTVTDLRATTTVSVAQAGAFLGMSTATAYRAVAEGTLPVITVGKTRRVPTPRLLALVGVGYKPQDDPGPLGGLCVTTPHRDYPLTVAEAARALGVSKSKAYEMADAGDLPTHRDQLGRLRVNRTDLKPFLDAQAAEAAAQPTLFAGVH